MLSGDFQLYFCKSLAGLSNEGSVDPGDSSHSHSHRIKNGITFVPCVHESMVFFSYGGSHVYVIEQIHQKTIYMNQRCLHGYRMS